MAKQVKRKPIHVKNPKIGEKYYFRFAGAIKHGTLISAVPDLSSKDTKWFKLEDAQGTKYPVQQCWISKDKNNVKK